MRPAYFYFFPELAVFFAAYVTLPPHPAATATIQSIGHTRYGGPVLFASLPGWVARGSKRNSSELRKKCHINNYKCYLIIW